MSCLSLERGHIMQEATALTVNIILLVVLSKQSQVSWQRPLETNQQLRMKLSSTGCLSRLHKTAMPKSLHTTCSGLAAVYGKTSLEFCLVQLRLSSYSPATLSEAILINLEFELKITLDGVSFPKSLRYKRPVNPTKWIL